MREEAKHTTVCLEKKFWEDMLNVNIEFSVWVELYVILSCIYLYIAKFSMAKTFKIITRILYIFNNTVLFTVLIIIKVYTVKA